MEGYQKSVSVSGPVDRRHFLKLNLSVTEKTIRVSYFYAKLEETNDKKARCHFPVFISQLEGRHLPRHTDDFNGSNPQIA
jgi:hypothetical protein